MITLLSSLVDNVNFGLIFLPIDRADTLSDFERSTRRNEKKVILLTRQLGLSSGIRAPTANAMAQCSTEFFVNVADNANLDHSADSCTRADYAEQNKAAERGLVKPLSCASYGYTVFGRVSAGMETIFDIEIVDTNMSEDRMDVPLKPVIIRAIVRLAE